MLLLPWLLTHLACYHGKPRCGRPCSRTKTSGRGLTSRLTRNALSRRSSALRCLRQSYGQPPQMLDQAFPLGGALSHTTFSLLSVTSSSPLPPAELRSTALVVEPQSILLGGALSHTTQCASPASTTSVTPAAVMVVATPTVFAATLTLAVHAIATVAASLFSQVAFRLLFLRGSARIRSRGHRRGPSEGP